MTEDHNQNERWRLEHRVDQLDAEIAELRPMIAALEEVFAFRQRGLYKEAGAILDDLQRNWVAYMRDRYPDSGR
jgi:peptidoglycan hydrolase CwlO-like protein